MEDLYRLKDLLWQWFLEESEQPGFELGVCVGLLVAGGVALLVYFIFTTRVWWGQVSAPYRPQTVTQTFTTKDTPARVMSRSLRAIVIGFVIVTCVICMLVEMAFPGSIASMIRLLVP